jgi:hypothetical protein
MDWRTNPNHPFVGIAEKLKRANENIRNLQAEIGLFFQTSKYPVMPDVHDDRIFDAMKYHRDRPVPVRFKVLSGEIIHHLRSCLDHVVWEFSDATSRKKHFRQIEFPVFKDEPIDKKKIASYEGKIQGITNPDARTLIGNLQPYKTSDPLDCPLLILHYMDIFDKHRELIIVASNVQLNIPRSLYEDIMRNKPPNYEIRPEDFKGKLKGNHYDIPQISFRNFGRRPIRPVIPGLTELYNHVVKVIDGFAIVKV